MNVQDVDRQMEYYTRLRQILTREPSNETEAVFLKYIELRRTARVAEYLNALGFRVKGPRKDRLYISTDITEILDSEASVDQVDPVIYDLVKQMQKSGRLLQRHLLGTVRK